MVLPVAKIMILPVARIMILPVASIMVLPVWHFKRKVDQQRRTTISPIVSATVGSDSSMEV